MKKWMQKLAEQLDFHWKSSHGEVEISEERATILYMIDSFSRHLSELDSYPVRKVRETLDGFSKEIIGATTEHLPDILFRFRQFFGSYRIEEYTYVQKTLDDFRHIVLDLVNQLSDDLSDERREDVEVKSSLDDLREAVETNSIDLLKTQSRRFIDTYVQVHNKKEKRRAKRMDSIKSNLDVVKKQLDDANLTMRLDHLTKAFNRRTFDEQMRKSYDRFVNEQKSVSLLMLDIDHFKKFNDTYGHATGDFILKECVRTLKELFGRAEDVVARIGGEEFAIVLPDYQLEHAKKKAEIALQKIASEIYVIDDMKLHFTVSLGVSQLHENESVDDWIKRTDYALYQSKNTGRNKWSVAPYGLLKTEEAAS